MLNQIIYKMKWNKIIVLILVLCLSQFTFGQNEGKGSDKPITIKGKVLNQNQDPVPDAVFYIDNIQTNNITKEDGSYKIKVSSSAINLEVRSLQYGTLETPINGQTNINFTLNATDENGLSLTDTSVVTVSYNKTTGSKGKKMNTYNDIYQMLRGEVSGVVVSGRSVQIQQGHSFFGSGTPLFVLNGVKVNSIDDVNPLEVKSIRVLKGSEAAIYGLDGSNGVISITLKNGTEYEN
jgi:TonB-dependent SusC/RagA subfamily outer membrane receptor